MRITMQGVNPGGGGDTVAPLGQGCAAEPPEP